jgi:HK97 family phage major capsid protein
MDETKEVKTEAKTPEVMLREIETNVEKRVEEKIESSLVEKIDAKFRAALADLKPKVEPEVGGELYRVFKDAAEQKRAISINGAGAVNVVNNIVSLLTQKKAYSSKFSYFYGPNASTIIPVFSALPSLPSAVAEGGNITTDTAAGIGATTILPKAYPVKIPVSAEALLMTGADLEGKIYEVIRDVVYARIARDSLIGSGAGDEMLGVFVDSALSNDVACAAIGAPKLADLLKLASEVQDYTDDAAIIINPAFFVAMLGETTSDLAWLKEELGRNGSVLGIPVIRTKYAPTTTTAGSVVAVAMPLSNYAVAMAQEVKIDVIPDLATTYTYFRATAFFNGKPILAANGWQLKTV